MADFFTEMLADIDKLTEEQVNQLMAALECKKSGCHQAIKDSIGASSGIGTASTSA